MFCNRANTGSNAAGCKQATDKLAKTCALKLGLSKCHAAPVKPVLRNILLIDTTVSFEATADAGQNGVCHYDAHAKPQTGMLKASTELPLTAFTCFHHDFEGVNFSWFS